MCEKRVGEPHTGRDGVQGSLKGRERWKEGKVEGGKGGRRERWKEGKVEGG